MNKLDNLQVELLYHKYLYYEIGKPILSDYEYDMLEKRSFQEAKENGYNAEPWENPDEDEKHHVHWMVGFSKESPYWGKVVTKYKIMKKLIKTDLDETQITVLRHWLKVEAALKSFSNNAKPVTFESLFPEKGEKLWMHFVQDCGRDFTKFRTYLTAVEFDNLLINAMYNDKLYL